MRLIPLTFVGNPAFDNIRFPHELQVGTVVQQCGLPASSQCEKMLELLLQLVATILDS